MKNDTIILREIVEKALGLELKDVESIVRAGGLTNKSYKVNVEDKDYIIRLPGPGTAELINRNDEKINTRLINKLDIDGDMVYSNPDTGVKVSVFIEGAKELNCQTARLDENISQVADVMRQLHTSDIVMNNTFNVFEKIIYYEKLVKEVGGVFYPDYESTKKSVMDLENILETYNVPLVACHNDTVPSNFISNYQGRIYLIDWEYSGMNDPMWDLAAYSLRCEFSEAEEDKLLSLYFKGTYEKQFKDRVRIYKICQDLLWTLWALYKDTQGESYSDYALKRYKRAKEALVRYEENKTIQS